MFLPAWSAAGLDGPPSRIPPAALEVLAALGVPPAAALFVGDSDVDMQTAHNAGMRSAGAVWGFRGEEELRRAGAGILLRKPVEIVNCC